MNFRRLGRTGLLVSEIGFGAWAIGGPAMAGKTPIGWGDVDDEESIRALRRAVDLGVNFIDTADFYGLGHSEEIIGKALSDIKNDIIIATKVGHELLENGTINLNYSGKYILDTVEKSLIRLKRDFIDLYQLHSAKLDHLENGECIEAMELLKKQGKIRFWGISLNTYDPEPEFNFLLKNDLGDTIQVALNIINQISLNDVIPKAHENDYGIIARMPLQFGLLAGKFTEQSKFDENDHRSFRLNSHLIKKANELLRPVFQLAEKYNTPYYHFALSFVLNHHEVSVVIPGIKTVLQAELNTKNPVEISVDDMDFLYSLGREDYYHLLMEFKKFG